jgi:hypothetical protein
MLSIIGIAEIFEQKSKKIFLSFLPAPLERGWG